MQNLFFRIDPVLGIRKLRQEVWIAMAVILGIALLVCVELGEGRRSKAKTELAMENETFVKAGERILPVNKEIWDLVEGSPEAQLSGAQGTQGVRVGQGEGALRLSVPSASAAQSTSAASAARPLALGQSASSGRSAPASPATPAISSAPELPRFPAVEKKAVAVAGNATAGGTSSATGPVASETLSALGVLGLYNETARDLGRDLGLVKGSGVAYKRLDDQAIQNRDSAQVEQIAGLPGGTVISAELITGIISGSPTKVLMSVKQDVVLQEMVVIPAGAVLLGTAVPDYKAGRININVEWLICGNAEIKISGLVYDASGQAGLADRRINVAARKLIPAFFAGILAEFGRALSGQQAVIPELALAKGSESNPMMQVLVDGTGSGLDAVARVLAEQAAQEGTVIIVNPGKLIRIVLLQKIPFDILVGVCGGSRVR